jgi:hypothetical protein
MNEEATLQPDLWTLAGQIATATESETFFIRVVRETGDYTDPGVRSLVLTGIRTLIENSKTDTDLAKLILEKYILPRCLERDSFLPSELLLDRDAREILSDWLGQYPDETRVPLRSALLEQTARAVAESSSVPSINTLAAFGLRSRWIEQALGRLVDQEGPVGDAAINALSSLSPTGALRSRLIRAVIERDPFRTGRKLNYAIQELASPQFVPMLRQQVHLDRPDLWIEPFLLGRIAGRLPGDRRLQSRVWQVFGKVIKADQDSARRVLATGNTFVNCNTPEVVEYLLARVGRPGFDPHSAYNHLKNCFRPAQLEGWRTDVKDLKARLTEFATLPGSQTRSVTIQDTFRQAAWETAFCAGVVDIVDWLERADLRSPFGVAEMLTYASYTPVSDWPAFVTRLIMERVDIGAGGDLWYSARIAATKAVAAAESLKSLELLLNCGLTGGGAPLLSTTKLAADVAERLSSHQPGELLAYLFKICEDRTRSVGRMSAIAALQRMAALKLMDQSHLNRLISIVADSSLPGYATAGVMWIIGTFEGLPLNNSLRACLVECLVAAQTSEEVKFQSLQAVIHLGLWPDYEQIVSEALNLVHPTYTIDISHLKGYQSWKAYALGLLVSRAPDTYRRAAKQVLEGGSGEAVHMLLRALDRGSGVRQDVADELGRAAIERSGRVLGLFFGETDNFDVIARLAPREFLFAGWESLWGDWMPQVRCALADGLQKVSVPGASEKDRILSLLKWLLADSTYMVRRSASRSFSRVNSTELRELCFEWMRSGQTELRIRSAESAQWLPIDNSKSIDNRILRDLLADPEPSVRAAAKRSAAELRERDWGAFALARIRSGHGHDGRNISELYCYGRALAALGDDETVTAINEIRAEPNIPIHLRNWLAKVAEDTAKHWKETAQGWPETIPAWSGQLEEIDGEFDVDERHYTTKISLWQRRREDPSDRVSWGGGFFEESLPERMRMFFAAKPEPLNLSIKGRRSAQILYNSVSPEGRILFVGTGPYPEPA